MLNIPVATIACQPLTYGSGHRQHGQTKVGYCGKTDLRPPQGHLQCPSCRTDLRGLSWPGGRTTGCPAPLGVSLYVREVLVGLDKLDIGPLTVTAFCVLVTLAVRRKRCAGFARLSGNGRRAASSVVQLLNA